MLKDIWERELLHISEVPGDGVYLERGRKGLLGGGKGLIYFDEHQGRRDPCKE